MPDALSNKRRSTRHVQRSRLRKPEQSVHAQGDGRPGAALPGSARGLPNGLADASRSPSVCVSTRTAFSSTSETVRSWWPRLRGQTVPRSPQAPRMVRVPDVDAHSRLAASRRVRIVSPPERCRTGSGNTRRKISRATAGPLLRCRGCSAEFMGRRVRGRRCRVTPQSSRCPEGDFASWRRRSCRTPGLEARRAFEDRMARRRVV